MSWQKCMGIKRDVDSKEKEYQKSKFYLLAYLTKWHLKCLELVIVKGSVSFPKEDEKILLDRITTLLKNQESVLINLDVKNLKSIGVILLDYDVGVDPNFKMFLVQSLLSSYDKIFQKVKSSTESVSKENFERFDKNDHIELELFRNAQIYKYLNVRRDAYSLNKIDSTIESFKQILGKGEITLDEKRSFLQTVFHVTGEYLKNTQETPNLSDSVRKSLEKEGIPVQCISEFRDLLAHQLLPAIGQNDKEIKKFSEESLIPIQNVLRSEIIKIEKSFIQDLVEETAPKIVSDKIKKDMQLSSKEDVAAFILRIENVKKDMNEFSSLERNDRKLINGIYQKALQMKSRHFPISRKQISPKEKKRIASEISTSVTGFIRESKLKVYEMLYKKFELTGIDKHISQLATAHGDVLKIESVVSSLRYGGGIPSDVDNFLSEEILTKIKLEDNVRLKDKLQPYFDAERFKETNVYYPRFKDIKVEGLIETLNKVSEPAETKSKLIDFLKAISDSQGINSNYVTPDECGKLVGVLNNNKEKLLAFSAEWGKVRSLIGFLKNIKESNDNKTTLIKFFESISAVPVNISPGEYKELVDALHINNKDMEKFNSFSGKWEKVKRLVDLLNNISEPSDNKSKLITFFESISTGQDIDSNYIPQVEYRKLVNGLKIASEKDKNELLSFSVESDKVKNLVDLLKNVHNKSDEKDRLISFFKSAVAKISENPLSGTKYGKLLDSLNIKGDDKKNFSSFWRQWQSVKHSEDLLKANSENEIKLINFFKSICAAEDISSKYIPQAEYKLLVDDLKINSERKEKLISLSVEWERVRSLISLVDNNSESDTGKSKLTAFFKSISKTQDIRNDYILPEEYKKLVDGLNIPDGDKEKLHSFSVEWRKKKCIDLLESKSLPLKWIYDSVIKGKEIIDVMYVKLDQLYANKMDATTKNVKIDKLVTLTEENAKKLYSSEMVTQLTLLTKLSSFNAIKAQLINIYSFIKKHPNSDTIELIRSPFRRLRNLLSHDSSLMSVEDNEVFAKHIENLKNEIKKINFNDRNVIENVLQTFDDFSKSVLKETIQPSEPDLTKKSNLNNCARRGARRAKRFIECFFSKDDVEKFSKGKVDENDVDKIVIDSENFLTFVKNSQDERKNAQLIEFIGDKSIEGDYKYLVDGVIQDQGFERFIRNERTLDLYTDISQQDVSSSKRSKSSKLKGRVLSAVSKIQLLSGIHSAITSCKDGSATDCGLNVGGMAWSFASQPIEDVMVKMAPKITGTAEKVVGRFIHGSIGKQATFVVRLGGVKFGSKIAKGMAGGVIGVFDIYDIGMSASSLVDCGNREETQNPCEEKEIRDSIASIAFSTVSFTFGVALAAASLPGVGIAVGFALMVAQGVYSGVSNIIEYEKKYDTTHDENWRIFWHAIFLQSIPYDVQLLADRGDTVNDQAKKAWNYLCESPSDVVAYGIGFGERNETSVGPGFGKILMNRKDANTENLSRVIPNPIQYSTMICLPQFTDRIYEKSMKKTVPTAVHFCENTMVISDSRRMPHGNTIIYDLESINNGQIVGSEKLNNYFSIFEGTTTITGGSGGNIVNKFICFKLNQFIGTLIGGYNATNIIDLSQSLEHDPSVNVIINYFTLDNKIFIVRIVANGQELVHDIIDGHNVDTFKYYYNGKGGQVNNVVCMYDSQRLTTNGAPDIYVNSGGGSSRDKKDIIDNCKKVAVYPNTKVTGARNIYTFYVKTAEYIPTELQSNSEIDVDGTGTVVFPDNDLLNDFDEITYSSDSNIFSFKIGLGQDNQYTLNIKNYMNKDGDQPNFKLIDKSGSNIVPKIGKAESSTTIINSFQLHAEHSFDSFNAAESHYKKLLSNSKGYKVFGVLRQKNQSNGSLRYTIFGSSDDEIINFDQRNACARGGNGNDVYVIDNKTERREFIIDNRSDDNKLDNLVMQEWPEQFSVQNCDLNFISGNTHVRIENYLKNNSYRHLMFTNKKGETFIPYMQRMSCAGSSDGRSRVKIVPFLHATPTQNLFLLSKDFGKSHVAVDTRLEDIERCRKGDDLLLIMNSKDQFIIKIENFYNDQANWRDVNFLLWNNGDFAPYFALYQGVNEVIDCRDTNDYEKYVKEYVIDFRQSVTITHNQDDTFTSVGKDEERIGVVILKNITPNRIDVSSSKTDLLLSDKVSKHVIKIKNWNNSKSHRVSTLEFDLGLQPIIIRRLERFTLSNIAQIQKLINEAFKICQLEAKLQLDEQLLAAAQDDDFSKIKGFANRCVSINAKDKNGSAPLHYAAARGNLEAVKHMIKEEKAEFEKDDIFKRTPLHLAAIYGHLKVVKYLKQMGAALNSTSCNEETPLHSAAENGKLDVVKYLVDEGTSINVINKNSKTPLNLAVRFGRTTIVEFLKQTQIQLDKNLLTAAAKKDLPKVRDLVSRGANVNATDSAGNTSLDIARNKKHIDIVKYLVEELNKHKHVRRNRRDHEADQNRNYLSRMSNAISSQSEEASSGGIRPSSWINKLFGWVGRILDSKSAGTEPNTSSSTSQFDSYIDVNGTIMLLDLLIRKVTGQKCISSVENSISLLEAQGYALIITKRFEKVVKQAALKSGVSMHRLNIDSIEVQKEITKKMVGGQFDEISLFLKLHTEKACPGRACHGQLSSKKFNKFLTEFTNEIDMTLNSSIQQMLLHSRDNAIRVDDVREQRISLNPKTNLYNTLVQRHLTHDSDSRPT